ncbi:MAG: GAF domain-containing protein [Myxacorys chilensis ATA2-1-KO14]|jgi:signal transduction histidine kinase|nr:GAF domain-containing protein [Myxacorys chilensis ATA2-1-KO14]
MPFSASTLFSPCSTSISGAVNLTAVLRACQAFSREVELEKLMAALLWEVSEFAGAEKCVLLMYQESQWVIEAIAQCGETLVIGQSVSVDISQAVPVSLVGAVSRTLQPIVHHNAVSHNSFSNDRYLLHHQPKNVLCAPLLNQGKLIAILYLENSRHLESFTCDRVEGLNLLFTHAAIALDHAILYQNLHAAAAIARVENVELKNTLAAVKEQVRQVEFRAEIDFALTNGSTLQDVLKHCTDAVVKHLDAAFARIWILNTAENVLELQVSSGLYTHINGDHARVPVGMFKIGWIAQERQPHLTNSVLDDPRVGNKDWARREGMVAFAGYPLLIEGRLVGVIAMFAHKPLNDSVLESLKLAATDVALGVVRKQTEEALYGSEAQLRQQTQELQQALQDLQKAQALMVQSEKMSALGNLMIGVAHEINNPVGFLAGNITPAMNYVEDLMGLIRLYQQKYSDAEIEDRISAIDLDYIGQDLPKLIGSMREGVSRIRGISTSLRSFARADCDRAVLHDLHEGIDSTLLILKHRLKGNEARPAIGVIKEYGQLPLVECFAGQLNQVFMNLLANAIEALEESNVNRTLEDLLAHPNQITIRTAIAADQQQVAIAIADNGLGMSDEIKEKIFNHLFTTKAVGVGTGLGLSIARSIVVEKHAGTIEVNSILGQGTEFVITLPIEAAGSERQEK